ncbi:MAG: 50S ribosomal protein P1 [Candidatus Aenigmarchaeota archaeon]|nr:50S ribosomal protein P1 [Candidatus Aenigmarchaeota archaeon]NIP39943.1 50S ribosomal protein P1 [Candidatus Aenigmarchaeota archaeon]NIQ17662.1 50S ribosomal protein P1 [Candidatus Aenigmarchaeota archaeon]NIS72850.1 50S ribosomal protein P1 [Candidatus Aenigmarchaeota archaeon]
MEMVYAALLLHSLGKKVDEAGVKKVLEAAGAKVEAAQIKALVSSLKDVNIDEAIKQTSVVQAAAPAAAEEKKVEKEEKKEEEKAEKKAEEAAAGLGALFG